MANKWMQKLQKLEGAVIEKKDIFSKTLGTPSPSVNFIFGKAGGLPFGYTALLYGPTKGGKSVLSHMMIGWLHQNDPEAIAIKFDVEQRADGQLDNDSMKLYGIDNERLQVVSTNSPSKIFDQIEKHIAAHCQNGAPIKLIVIDSVSAIRGRRGQETESVESYTIGDHAQTIGIGLQRIQEVIRKYDIALVLICQARAEMDMNEQKRGNKFKMQAGFALQHFCEYFIVVEANKNKEGRQDILGNDLVAEGLTDLAGKGEQTGMKIRAKMKDSNMGPKGRTAEFTFDFHKGLVNVHEEVFKLGVNRGIVDRPNNLMYGFGGKSWKGKEQFLEALKTDKALCAGILAELKRRDWAGEFKASDAAAEKAAERILDDEDEDEDD